MEKLTKNYVASLLPKRTNESHKGTYGNILNIAGSEKYCGAAILSSLSALKVGAGYVTLACTDVVAQAVRAYTPDVVLVPLASCFGAINCGFFNSTAKKLLKILSDYRALSLGCGLMGEPSSKIGLKIFLKYFLNGIADSNIPVVIDADGLNLLSDFDDIKLPKNTILTPHPKELSRLIKVDVAEIQSARVKYAEFAAAKYETIIVLKGHETIITDGDKTFVNTTGCSALSKAGMGDVLTGMISGFCAQNVSSFDAVCLGVYLHGLAGDLAKEKYTEYGCLASELQDFIPESIKSLQS